MTEFNPHTAQVADLWIKGDTRVRAHLEEMHAHYVDAFQPLEESAPGNPGIAAGLHMKVDGHMRRLVKDHGKGGVSCARGCSACCYLNVRVTREEAALLWHRLRFNRQGVDRARLEAQAAAGESLDAWAALPPEKRRCVFLKNGECSVYADRPAACRKYLVKSPPEFCDTVKHNGARVKIFVAYEAEVIYSAALAVFESYPLAVGMLATEADSLSPQDKPQ